jgi:gliding motility-associated-like protein
MNRIFTNASLVFTLVLGTIFTSSKAQVITVTSGQSATVLAQELAGQGITVANAVFNNCDAQANGTFTATGTNLNMDCGIILTSGDAMDAAGPSAVPSNGNSNFYDPDLDLLTTSNIRDACVLEFDFVPTGDTVTFKYVFGSAEYQSYTCTVFEDVFGFFVSGPGLAGPYSNSAINVAIVPGTVACPVTVNTINSSMASPCGTQGPPCSPPNNAFFYQNLPTGNTNTGVAYNGYTYPLTAVIPTVACSTYHMKLAISDAADQALDSGVFLEAGSLTSNAYKITKSIGSSNPNNPFLVEGCDTAKIRIVRKLPSCIAGVPSDTIFVSYAGTATMGADYPNLPNQYIFTTNPNDTVYTLDIPALSDGITEGIETVKIYFLRGCFNNVKYDSVVFNIYDPQFFTLGNPDTNICLGQSVQIYGDTVPGITYTWSPAAGVTNPTTFLTTISPTNIGTNMYIINGSYAGCPPTNDTLNITVDPVPIISPISDESICEGDSITITATVSPPFNYNYTYTPSGSFINQNGTTATFVSTQTTNVTFTASSPNAQCTASDDFTITVWPFLQGAIRPDTLVCNGDPVQLWVTGGIGQYQWYPANTLSCEFCPNPIATTLGNTVYSAILLEPHGCQDTLRTVVEVHPPFSLVLANNDTTIYIGESVELYATGAPYYYWSPTNYMTYTQSNNPLVTPLETTTYVVTGVSDLQGCPQKDSVKVTVLENDVWVPTVFSPNGDGKNDIFKILTGRTRFVKIQEFKIYNRWGTEIYNGKDVSQGWDGTYKGQPQDTGTYFYQIRVAYPTGRVGYLKGDFTLIR